MILKTLRIFRPGLGPGDPCFGLTIKAFWIRFLQEKPGACLLDNWPALGEQILLGKKFAPKMNRFGQFSLGWCVGTIFLHAAVTLALALLLFVGGMGSFTYGPGAGFYVTKAVMWIWSPFAMAADNVNNGIGIALLWSLFVGVLAGFIVPLFIKPKTQKPLPPGANPDLVGTPWEQKTPVRFETLREAEDKRKEEEA